MTVFRSPMEKVLTEQENETVVTNPGDSFGTFRRKIAYKFAVWRERLRHLLSRSAGDGEDEDGDSSSRSSTE